MQGRQYASLLIVVWFFEYVSCYEEAIIPVELPKASIDEASCSFDFQKGESQPIGTPEALSLFPLVPGGTRNTQKRVPDTLAQEGRHSKRPRPTYAREEYDGHLLELFAHGKQPSSPDLSTLTPNQVDETSRPATDPEEQGAVYSRVRPAAPGRSPVPEKLLNELQRTALESGATNQIARAFSHSKSSPMQPLRKVDSATATARILGEKQRSFWIDLSSPTLDWNPPVINQKAALATHFMAIHFQQAVARLPCSAELNRMHESHLILLPFVYKLMLKPLTTVNWSTALLVWRNLWHEEENLGTGSSTEEVLEKFLWISHFISEATIPEIFQDVPKLYTKIGVRKARDGFHCFNHETRIIKLLSDGRMALNDLSKPQLASLQYLKSTIASECHEVSPDLVGSADTAPAWELVLSDIGTKAHQITAEASETVVVAKKIKEAQWSFLLESLWEKVVFKPGGRELMACAYLLKPPTSLKGEIENLFRIVQLDRSELPVFQAKPFLLRHLIKQFDKKIKPNDGTRTQLEGRFLSEKIHNFFAKATKKFDITTTIDKST
ncbi:hypothetical protein PSTG_02781 [Puccinia striiformis f. sp. tritici PST-78]|uniref:Uncharacterized protein n=1 Tax=Puccinia striiformis f. sp. tritici PST-78 TaxID=1165861 RepID=A0A0L0VXT5_9BASI|nr:hypothetical protein PSTG_02781 [Puccinia striiformis f. sp. tritici PST-78]